MVFLSPFRFAHFFPMGLFLPSLTFAVEQEMQQQQWKIHAHFFLLNTTVFNLKHKNIQVFRLSTHCSHLLDSRFYYKPGCRGYVHETWHARTWCLASRACKPSWRLLSFTPFSKILTLKGILSNPKLRNIYISYHHFSFYW